MLAIIKKEFKNYFLSPIGYIFVGLFLAISGVFFYLYTFMYGSLEFAYVFYNTATALTFITPILTMRMFAEERKNGTEQLLFTSPTSITSIVLGKFISAVLVICITEVLSLMYLAIICYYGAPAIPATILTLVGFILLSMAYISFGMLASSLTENQIIAATITIGFFIITWFLPDFSANLSMISLVNLFGKFPEGVIPIEETVSLVSFTIVCILLTIIIMQRRKNLK